MGPRGTRQAFCEMMEQRDCPSAVAFVEHAFESELNIVTAIHTADVDVDGDLDIIRGLGASLAWYENMDGDGSFANVTRLIEFPAKVVGLSPADIDTDGDVDFVVKLQDEDEWIWAKNMRDQGIVDGGILARTALWPGQFLDFDSDGDVDIVSTRWNQDEGTVFYLFENELQDAVGLAGPKELLTLAYDFVDGEFSDVDGDGDLDFLGIGMTVNGNTRTTTIMWRENLDGDREFGEESVIENSSDVLIVQSSDLDSDGDIDVIASGLGIVVEESWVQWHENIDGLGTFSGRQVISESSTSPRGAIEPVNLSDIDGDSDIDVMLDTDRPGTIVWIDNADGLGELFERRIVVEASDPKSHVSIVGLVDLDGDHDVDVLSQWQTCINPGSCEIRRHIAWYENRLIGDSNDDGVFDSGDLVKVIQAGKYEDSIHDNTTFDEGDWNQDGDFDSSDLVLAFQGGHYEAAARLRAAEIAAAVDLLFTQDDDAKRSRAVVA